jgi:uncharacterized protein involved in cysteine biosynthesis
MFEAAAKALSQMFSPPFRSILLRSIAVALVLIVFIGAGVYHLFTWFTAWGEAWFETALGPQAHTPLTILAWIVSIATGLGIIVGSVFLMPAVTALVASFFVDEIALEVERAYYPDEPAGTPLPVVQAAREGGKTALLAVLVYLLAVPFLLVAGLGVVIFFLAAAYLLSREYFELAAMRFRPPEDAKAMRKANQAAVFAAGLLIALFVSIPVVNLATPLFGMALMVHLHKQLSRRPQLVEAARNL